MRTTTRAKTATNLVGHTASSNAAKITGSTSARIAMNIGQIIATQSAATTKTTKGSILAMTVAKKVTSIAT